MTAPLSLPRAAARTAYATGQNWESVLDEVLQNLELDSCDLVFISLGGRFLNHAHDIAQELWARLGAPVLFGSSSSTVILDDREDETGDQIALLALNLPGGIISTARITNLTLENTPDPAAFRKRLNVLPDEVNTWIVLSNPLRFETGQLLALLETAYPDKPVLGGMTSPSQSTRQSMLVLNEEAFADGAILLGIGGAFTMHTFVSHGSDPVGDPWTITGVSGEWIESIGNRPALDVVEETLRNTPGDLRPMVQSNLLVGFAIDEYRSEFFRSDFIVRSMTGIDQASRSIATGFLPVLGQTIQFQLRDAATADLDLTLCLDGARLELTGRRPLAALMFSNDQRGKLLFGSAHHDAALVRKKFPPVPLLGAITSAEIGPATGRTILNTGSVALGLLLPA